MCLHGDAKTRQRGKLGQGREVCVCVSVCVCVCGYLHLLDSHGAVQGGVRSHEHQFVCVDVLIFPISLN